MSNSIYNTLWYTLYAAMTIFDMMHNCKTKIPYGKWNEVYIFISSLFIFNLDKFICSILN